MFAKKWNRLLNGSYGLVQVPEPFPLLIIFSLIVRVQFSDKHEALLLHLPLALLLLGLNFRIRFPRLFFLSLFTTFFYLFVGNILFLPANCNYNEFAIFNAEIECAIFAALPRVLMLLYGFAWINYGSTHNYLSCFIKISNMFGANNGLTKYICGAFCYFSSLSAENEVQEHALKMHLTSRGTRSSLSLKIRLTWLRLSSTVLKMFFAIPSFTYTLYSRFHNENEKHFGSKTISSMSLTNYRSDFRSKEINIDVQIPEIFNNVIDISDLSSKETDALINVVSGVVPHLKGNVKGKLSIGDTNYLELSEDEKLSVCRRVDGKGGIGQLLGPTVWYEMLGSVKSPSKIRESLGFWGLTGFESKLIGSLSGGERVRLALASAMICSAQIIILDRVDDQLDVDGKLLLDRWTKTDTNRIFISKKVGDRNTHLLSPSEQEKFASEKLRTLIRLEGVSLERGNRVLFENFSHTFKEGRLTLLTGPNGSGKTSLGLAIGGALKFGSGVIIRNIPLGMSFQNPIEQFMTFTVKDELSVRQLLLEREIEDYRSWYRSILKMSALKPKDEVLTLTKFDERSLSIYSMLYRSGFLILDEPTNFLSFDEQIQLVKKIEKLKRFGLGVLVISHNPEIWSPDETIDLGAKW